jgi:hypothetical protein
MVESSSDVIMEIEEEKAQDCSQLEMNIKSSQHVDQENANIIGSLEVEKEQSNQKCDGRVNLH